jgi:hypothetical protein
MLKTHPLQTRHWGREGGDEWQRERERERVREREREGEMMIIWVD